MTIPALCSFFLELRDELKNRLKSHFKGSIKDEDRTTSTISLRKHKESSSIFEVSLEKQLQAWKENPIWEDQSPDIKVTVPKGSLSNLNLKVDVGLPPDAVYNILIDPANKRVFKNIKEVISRRVLVDEGARQLVELEQAALWRFLWWSGTISVHVLVDQNREDYSMKFKQLRTGFMKRFEGCWKVEPVLLDQKLCHPFKPKTVEDYISYTKGKGRVGSKLSLEQIIEPAMVPPPPISWYLRGITTRTTEMLINDLITETARIRGVSDTENSGEHGISEKMFDACQVDEFGDIKERWTMRRRIARQCHRRLPLTVKSWAVFRVYYTGYECLLPAFLVTEQATRNCSVYFQRHYGVWKRSGIIRRGGGADILNSLSARSHLDSDNQNTRFAVMPPDLARTIAGLILSSNDSNFQGECILLLGLQSDEMET